MTEIIRFCDCIMTVIQSWLAYSFSILLDNYSGNIRVFKMYKSGCSRYPPFTYDNILTSCIEQENIYSSKSLNKKPGALDRCRSSFKNDAIFFLAQILKIENTKIYLSIEITALQNILLGLLSLSNYANFHNIPSEMFEGTLH